MVISLFSLDFFLKKKKKNGNTHLTFQSCTCEFFSPSSMMYEIKLLKSDKNKEDVNFALKTRYQWFRNTINIAGRTLPEELLTFISSFKICKICEYHALGPNKYVKKNILNIRINN